MYKKGFVPITILLVLSLIIPGIVLVGKNKTPKDRPFKAIKVSHYTQDRTD